MTRLSTPMRNALEAARRIDGLRRTHDPTKPGAPQWPAHHSTLAALVRREFLTRDDGRNRKGWPRTTWSLTDAGREALKPREVFRVEAPRYMCRGGTRFRERADGAVELVGGEDDYTSDPRRSIDTDYPPGSKGPVAVPGVGERDLDRFTQRARRREADRVRANGRRLDTQSLEARIAGVEAVARGRHADVSGELRLVRHMLVSGRVGRAVARLERLEAGFEQRAA